MGRPERPLDLSAGPLPRFAAGLRELRSVAGRPSYRELARRANYSVTALSEAAGGEILPTLGVTLAYVQACGGDRDVWRDRWHALAEELSDDQAEPTDDVGEAPYLGLGTFEPADSDRFFGRQKWIDELATRLADSAFLAVFGASGSGKSSLLRAGLLSRLCPDSTLLFTPGDHPLDELAVRLGNLSNTAACSLREALSTDPTSVRLTARQALVGKPESTRLVVVIDQFEEIFTLCQEDRERKDFICCLLALAGTPAAETAVVLGVRADFYPHCSRYPELLAAVQDHQVLIGPMQADDLRSAIRDPAAQLGIKVETALVETLVNDAEGQSGALPLVSHALLETWRRRKGDTLTLAGYRQAGGVRGAIALTAEQTYNTLAPERQPLVRDVFVRLTVLGDGTDDTRRRVQLSELRGLALTETVDDVLAVLAAARLITLGTDTVELAHEVLIRCWPRLRGWLGDDREALRAHRRLTDAATDWDLHGRDDGLLYRGALLAFWDGRDLGQLNDLERDFLTTSRDRKDEDNAAHQRRRRRARAALVSALTVMSVLAALAIVQTARMVAQRNLAVARQLVADARAQLQLDPELGLLLARQAYQTDKSDETVGVLRQAVLDSRVRATLTGHHGKICGAAFSPDGRRLATSGADGTVRLWTWPNHAEPRVFTGHQGEVWSPAFSADGRYLAAAGIDGLVTVWDLAGTAAPKVLRGHQDKVWSVAFSPDGRRLASASDDGTVRVWDLADDTEPVVLAGGHGRALGVAFSPDGRLLAVSGSDGTVRMWDWASKQTTVSLRGHRNTVEGVAFAPDGRHLATASTDGSLRVWDMSAPDAPWVLGTHDGTVEGVAYSRDGRRVASVGSDGTIRIWNAAGGTDGNSAPLVLRGHHGAVWTAAFSPDGRQLVSASDDGTARVWDVSSPGDPVILRGHDSAVWTVALSPDGTQVASGGADGTIRVQAIDGRRQETVLHVGSDVNAVAFSPDGRRLAGASADGVVRVWEANDAPLILRGHEKPVWSVAFSPDGRNVVSGGSDGTTRVWPLDRPADALVLRGHQGFVSSVAFSPDGRRLGSTGADGTVRIWDMSGHGNPVVLRGHEGSVMRLAFSPDGTKVASSGNDSTVRIWPVDSPGEPLVLRGHQGIVWSVAFSPDGRYLATTGNDATTRLWAMSGAEPPLVFNGFVAVVEGVAVGVDGLVVTAHDDGTVRVWRCLVCGPIDEVAALADAHLSRELTAEERNNYLDPPGE